MKKLILMRHGNAENFHIQGDYHRPLSESGKEEARIMSATVAQHANIIDGFYASAAMRTTQTARIVSKHAALRVNFISDDKLYLASSSDLLHTVSHFDDKQEAVLLIGHNPGLYDIIAMLVSNPAHPFIMSGMPTCGLVLLHCNIAHWADIASADVDLHEFVKP